MWSTCLLLQPMGFVILVFSMSLMCLWVYFLFPWCVVPTLSVVLLLYIALLHSNVSRGRSCVHIVFCLLIMDCFGLCPMVVSFIKVFSKLNRVSSILYNFLYFFDYFLLTFKLKHGVCYSLTLPYLSSSITAEVTFLTWFINGGKHINDSYFKLHKL